MATRVGRRIEARGSVQGVGFRPWVWRLAHQLGVAGRVHNHAAGVTIDAFASVDVLDALIARMRAETPPAAVLRSLTFSAIPDEPVEDFLIVASAAGGPRRAAIPPDLATCRACLAEVFDPTNRRYRYPFTNCTDCGPRFTIAWDVPYDRPATSMASFRMCPACQAEYDDPCNRRFHAQPNACPACGPRLRLLDASGVELPGDPLAGGIARLNAGEVVAVHGLGGFHLAVDATSEAAVAALRQRKRREDKPFAVMVRDLAEAESLGVFDDVARAVIGGLARPITLVPWRDRARVAEGVAPDAPRIGLFLPYTPLHHLLLTGTGPLVMTSGNLSGEPIVHTEALALDRLGGIADVFLVHDRPITTRTDDAVATVVAGGPLLLRRSRGFVPRGIPVPFPFPEPVLAVGGDLKNTCCVGVGDEAFLGPHVGDVESDVGYDALGDAIERMERFLGVSCRVVAHDRHPGYLSTAWAQARVAARPGAVAVAVQHHHAHAAGSLAALGLSSGLAVVYDGTGYGLDETAWGAEILRSSPAGVDRRATWRPVALPGGDLAIHAPWRIALAWVYDALGELPDLPLFRAVPADALRVARKQLEAGVQTPLARGMGRKFDAAAALGLHRGHAGFEGQLAIAWEGAADGIAAPYPTRLDRTRTPWEVDDRPLVAALVADLRAGVPTATIAARFHAAVVAATVEVIAAVAADDEPVVLTGGCFANARLAEGVLDRVPAARIARDLPPGDGGLALGQAVVAARSLQTSLDQEG